MGSLSGYMMLNGELGESKMCSIGSDSLGLAYGYGIFETIRVFAGKPCFFEEHYRRLINSVHALGMNLDLSKTELLDQVSEVISENALDKGGIKIVCFKGSNGTELLIHVREVESSAIEGLSLNVSNVVKASKAVTSRHKTLNYLENLLELQSAKKGGFDECVFLNENGFVTECCTSNIFIVEDNVLRTPSLECGLLNGVIRGQVLEIAKGVGLDVEEGCLGLEPLETASEVFVTNSLRGISMVDSIRFPNSKEVSYNSSLGIVLALRLAEVERMSLDV